MLHPIFWHLVTTVIPVTFHDIHASWKTLTLCMSFVLSCVLLTCCLWYLVGRPCPNLYAIHIYVENVGKRFTLQLHVQISKGLFKFHFSTCFVTICQRYFFWKPWNGPPNNFAYSDNCRLCCMCDISCNMFELECMALCVLFVLACALQVLVPARPSCWNTQRSWN